MYQNLIFWIEANQSWLRWVGLGSLIMFVLTIIVVPVIVVKMEADHFLRDRETTKSVQQLLKNLFGIFLILSGIVLSIPLIPGQGLLTILIGLALTDFPGKRKLELRLLKLRPVHWAIQKLRKKADRPPLELPF